MITIISATNRTQSASLKIAKEYAQLLEKKDINFKLLSFEQLPAEFIFSDLFGKRSELFQQLLEEFIIPAQKMVIIAPEYNGSFPGLLKIFFDAIHPDVNRGKKAGLVGVSSGRAGNLRGMEDLTGILNYLGIYVMPNKLPISSVLTLLDQSGSLASGATIQALEKHVNELVAW